MFSHLQDTFSRYNTTHSSNSTPVTLEDMEVAALEIEDFVSPGSEICLVLHLLVPLLQTFYLRKINTKYDSRLYTMENIMHLLLKAIVKGHQI